MPTHTRARLVVLGLDGLPLDLAQQLVSRHPDRFPHLGRLTPLATTVRAELPEVSPVNWSSFATAAAPEVHGVTGFTTLDPARYTIAVADSTWLRVPTIFHRLGERGLVSRIVNLPNMYPVRPLKGMCIAGFVAPEPERAFFPPFLGARLRGAGYRLEADTVRGKDDPDFLLAELRATLASRRLALELLWPDLAWDLFVLVLTETDRLFHFHYPALLDPDAPLHGACLDLLVAWDGLIGELLQRYDALPEPKRLLVTADHGFAPLELEADCNAWLQAQGWLQLAPPPLGGRDELDATGILPQSRAFALDPGRIFLHDGRFARGQVTPREGPELLERLRSALLHWQHQGRPVLEEVLPLAGAYPEADGQLLLPDLLCLPAPGFDLKAKFNRREVFGFHGRRGTHRAEGAFFLDSAGARPQRLRDVGRLVMEYF